MHDFGFCRRMLYRRVVELSEKLEPWRWVIKQGQAWRCRLRRLAIRYV